MPFFQQKFREIVFQLLFSLDMGDSQEGDLIPFLMRECAVTRQTVQAAFQKAKAVWKKKEDLDRKIGLSSKEYALGRIKKVEINVLRLAIFELEAGEVPAIAIAEAIRMTRKFACPEAADFVNAVLDHYFKEAAARQA